MKIFKITSIFICFLIQSLFNMGYTQNNDINPYHEIYVAGGCFWGVEEYFSRIPGVIETKVGYINGNVKDPNYGIVSSGRSGYAEAVYIKYDNTVTLKTLLEQFFKIINPTAKNKQGNDIGTQYRTGIYFTDKQDLETINSVVNTVQENYKKKIETEILPMSNFYLAEDYHQKYLKKNPNGYCHISFDSLNDL